MSFFDRRRLKTLAKLPILFCAVGFAELVFMGKCVVLILKIFPFGMIWVVVAADRVIFPSQI